MQRTLACFTYPKTKEKAWPSFEPYASLADRTTYSRDCLRNLSTVVKDTDRCFNTSMGVS